MSKMIIQTKGLAKTFNAGKPNEVKAVDKINLEIAENTCTLLKGPSGSGKTTLLAVLSCLTRPSAGEYFCLQENVSHWSEKFLSRFRQKNIGIVFQHFQLISGFTAYLNIALPLIPLRYNSKEIDKKVKRVAEQVNILHRLNFAIDRLSGGELQRVAIARALVNNPTILFADEPTSHLDRENAALIMDIFMYLKQQGKSILIATHDPLVENHSVVDKIIHIKDGRII